MNINPVSPFKPIDSSIFWVILSSLYIACFALCSNNQICENQPHTSIACVYGSDGLTQSREENKHGV